MAARSRAMLFVLPIAAIPSLALAQAEPAKGRVAVLIDSSGSMVAAIERRSLSQTCVGFNPCAGSAVNPTASQETCNACVRDTIDFLPACANSWSASCASSYASCLLNVAGQASCSATMAKQDADVTTRGDGSLDHPGCDLNGDGIANESRLYAAKEGLRNLLAAYGELEFSLYRFSQIAGGQTCATDADCPDSPGGLSVLSCENHDGNAATANVCAFDADILDAATTAGFDGQCYALATTGSPAGFSCTACDFQSSYDRAACRFTELDRVRTSALSPLNGVSSVSCFPLASPQHRFTKYQGAFGGSGACDPNGADQLVGFPATGWDDNYNAISSWVDGAQTSFSGDDEIRATGGTPLAASLRDMRDALLVELEADPAAPCRPYSIAIVTDGGESCESQAALVDAALDLQALSFFDTNGNTVASFAVPVHVYGIGVCATATPNCAARQQLDALAAAGGTGSAVMVSSSAELTMALTQHADTMLRVESCAGGDSDCNGLDNELYPTLGDPCSEGVGACQQGGVVACVADTTELACTALPLLGAIESCDLADNDCDGLTDEGVCP